MDTETWLKSDLIFTESSKKQDLNIPATIPKSFNMKDLHVTTVNTHRYTYRFRVII